MANKTHEIHLRLSETEYQKLLEQQRFLGCPSYASLIRMYIHTGICYRIDYKGLSEVASQIARVGNNINQIAAVANATSEITPLQLEDVKKQLSKIEKILSDNISQKAEVTKKLGSFFSTDEWIDG
ncbi:MAG: MobC family plasmid mobilization relaxosome protein [Lachnospiraceae bacterium]|nr:MobC family plasmid mobilization relaxosome protein [Lachnospiraceae bacterium]